MEMAAAVCAVVNGGRLMQPYLVATSYAPDGSVLQHNTAGLQAAGDQTGTSATMREMMEAVVLYGGGRNAQIPGYRVGGKSGTSQKLDSADENARIASFVAVAPIDDPQFLCLVCSGRTPQLDDRRRQPVSPGLCRSAGADAGVQGGVPRAVEPETDPDPRPDRCRPARRR